MNNLTETQKEAMSSLVNLTEEFCNRELSQKAERLKSLFPEAFAEPEGQHSFVITIDNDFDKVRIEKILDTYTANSCYTIKELPELYTAEDMIGFADYWHDGVGKHDEISKSLKYWKTPKK